MPVPARPSRPRPPLALAPPSHRGHEHNLPGVVAASFAGEYEHSAVTASQVEELRAIGRPVSQAVAEILPFLGHGGDRLTAVREGRSLALEPNAWDLIEARRLRDLTQTVLADHDRRTS
ncbi:hypothetical protein [Candidatus Frankia nodulisporulans]|uniref:hypothetical protein n=1 Tax=Candidatus Frankia nodulisporulans TaxID=2060052 RepID=UPI0013D67F99|nr:hypothetical protein [Candidatus Frankia nodulisporulans]